MTPDSIKLEEFYILMQNDRKSLRMFVKLMQDSKLISAKAFLDNLGFGDLDPQEAMYYLVSK